ncbi:MAG: tripartite tricarboxylate transporter substrate binding protein BugD [Rhodocyclaceae bacterium]
MSSSHSRLARLAAALLLSAGLCSSALAQEYPAKTITVVVPFAAGGPTDTVARLVAQSMTATLKQQVIVENVGGAGGTLGAGRVARAAPDGYTLLLHHIGHSTAPSLYRKLAYDAIGDFEPIGQVADVPMTVVARGNFTPKDGKELITYLRANKDKTLYAHAGVGSASNLCGMLLMSALQTDMTTVPYQGTGPAMNDLLGGQVDIMCDQTTNTTGQIKGGKIKAYGVTSRNRIASLKDIPTMQEAGLPNFEVNVWHGLYAPKGTPKAIIDRLTVALQAAVKDPLVVQRLGELGSEPATQEHATPASLRTHLKAEIDKWGPIIKKAGIYAD